MNKPKRHHWWPKVQSQHWTDASGLIYVTRRDGSYFRPNPDNIAVESELYTRFESDLSKDTSIEEWFAQAIDGPAATMIQFLENSDRTFRRKATFTGDERSKLAEIGTVLPKDYLEAYQLNSEIRHIISSYIAALLVRSPKYLKKLTEFHENNGASGIYSKNAALENMMQLYSLYQKEIAKAVFIISRRIGTSEFLYSDGGLAVDEPWREGLIPFDIHAPITPDLAIQVLPVPFDDDRNVAMISDINNRGVSLFNRIMVGNAERFVFSRASPPLDFIGKNFGIPAPKSVGYRVHNGKFETQYNGRTHATPV